MIKLLPTRLTNHQTRREFMGLAGGAIGMTLLSGCGGGIVQPFRSRSHQSFGSTGLTPAAIQAQMKQHGVLAVLENGKSVVRDDMQNSLALAQHLSRLKLMKNGVLQRTRPTADILQNDPGDPNPGDGPPDPPSSQDCSNVPVGGTCNGLTIIGETTSTAGSSSLGFFPSDDFYSFQTFANLDNQLFSGALYTIQKFTNCVGSTIDSFISSMEKIAEGIVTGLLTGTVGAEAISALLGSSNAFLTSTISAAAFWDVLASVLTFTVLAAVLEEILAGITIAIAFESIWCLLQ